jgi:hypothetical protein
MCGLARNESISFGERYVAHVHLIMELDQHGF